MGTIEKRGKTSWRIGVQTTTPDGKKEWIRQSLSFPAAMPEDEQQHNAEVALARLLIAVEDGTADAGKKHTLRDLAKLWVDNHLKPNCEPPTVKTYQNFLDKRILPMIGDWPLDSITPLMMSTFMAKLRDEPVTRQALPDDQLKRKRTPSDQARRTGSSPQPPSDTTMTPCPPCSSKQSSGS